MTVTDRLRVGQETPPSADRVRVGIRLALHLAPNASASVKLRHRNRVATPIPSGGHHDPGTAMTAWAVSEGRDMSGWAFMVKRILWKPLGGKSLIQTASFAIH